MNVLFLVMNFLLICLFFNALILKNTAFFSAKQAHTSSYHASKLALQSKVEKHKYKTYKKSRLKTQKQPALKEPLLAVVSKGNATYTSHRSKEVIPTLGKWNLAALSSADPIAVPMLIELTEKLFQSLYGHASFWKEAEKQIPHFSHRIIASFLEKKDAIVISDLFPKDPQLQPIFYKMLQGSGFYNLAQHKGYPPLKDFCCFLEKNPALTSFPHAHILIINTLFTQELSQEIISLEHAKWEKDHKVHSLTKEELKKIFSMYSLSLRGRQFEQIEPFLQFAKQKDKQKKLIYKDQKTQIPLEISFPS
ncbi:MAG: hypothetical protein K2Y01_01810 [Rhabdochlamydiaceae bacterium]|nr:hypothetical protein [Rhabdochlamydiaceae bacterium]